MPILYPNRKELQPCFVQLTILRHDGFAAAYSTIWVYKIIRFLWWDIEWHIGTYRANAYGEVSFNLEKGARYRFLFVYLIAKKHSIWRTLTYCPYSEIVRMPP